MLARTVRNCGGLVLAVALAVGTVAAAAVVNVPSAFADAGNTRADPVGTLELAGSGWLGGQGVDVFGNGADPANTAGYNYVNGVLSGFKWQCVELVNRLYLTRGWISGPWSGHGNQKYATAPVTLTKQPQGAITYLNPGDVISLNGGGPEGHASVVASVSGSSVQIVNQNTAAVYSSAMYANGSITLAGWAGYSVIGVVHRPTGGASGTHNSRLTGDVNGDGKADAVVMFGDTGAAKVALSTGAGFGYPGDWSYGHSVGASRYFLGDVNGDGKADLLGYRAAEGRWHVSLSSGSGFWSPVEWAYGHGIGTSQQWVTDATGDGRADLVTFDAGSGDWWVSASSGSGFWSPVRWIAGHGVGSTDQVVADFNADGKADAAIYIASTGNWHVASSTGSAFGYPGQWSAGHGVGSGRRLAGDVNGDGKADAAYYWPGDGRWRIGTSSGGGFWTPTEWAYGHGIGTSEQFLTDVTGDGRADILTFDQANGDWYASASSGSGFWSPALWIHGHGAGS